MVDREKQKEENRKKFPVTASIVDDFKKLFGDVKVLKTNENQLESVK
ncbi:MAG: hypothetical protein QM500_08635 [Methylococcales bacterium]